MTPQEMRARRNEMKLTQTELAKRIGITLRHYQRLESGETTMTDTMAKVVKMELTKINRKKMTAAQFRSIKDDLTPDEIIRFLHAISSKIKIYYPAGLSESEWASPNRIKLSDQDVLIESDLVDENAYSRGMLRGLAQCLNDMVNLVNDAKLDEEDRDAFRPVMQKTESVLFRAEYMLR